MLNMKHANHLILLIALAWFSGSGFAQDCFDELEADAPKLVLHAENHNDYHGKANRLYLLKEAQADKINLLFYFY